MEGLLWASAVVSGGVRDEGNVALPSWCLLFNLSSGVLGCKAGGHGGLGLVSRGSPGGQDSKHPLQFLSDGSVCTTLEHVWMGCRLAMTLKVAG